MDGTIGHRVCYVATGGPGGAYTAMWWTLCSNLRDQPY
jgi:hypothetical protein